MHNLELENVPENITDSALRKAFRDVGLEVRDISFNRQSRKARIRLDLLVDVVTDTKSRPERDPGMDYDLPAIDPHAHVVVSENEYLLPDGRTLNVVMNGPDVTAILGAGGKRAEP